jgi:hypothetical protein
MPSRVKFLDLDQYLGLLFDSPRVKQSGFCQGLERGTRLS